MTPQVGFDPAEKLFPNDYRIFEGFDLLREFFMFPRKFLGFNLTHLDEVLPHLKAKTVDILFGFDEVNATLAAAVQREEVEYEIGLPGEGAETELFFSDLGHEYVTLNAEYTT